MGQVTIFKSIQSDSQCQYFEIDEVLDRIRRGPNRQLIERIRSEKNKQQRDFLKKQLAWICFSGKFSVRSNDAMISHSGFICLDFDGIPDHEFQLWRNKIKQDKRTYSLFTSPSGNGIKAIWRIPECKTNEEHNARFEAITQQFSDCRYFDTNVKGWNRVCFESYDPELYLNHDAEVFTGIVQREQTTHREFTGTDTDTIKLIEQLEKQQRDITDNYEDWLNIGFGLANKFGEDGRVLFHRISKISTKYNSTDCDRQYSACLKGSRTGVTIATLFHIAKQNDVYYSDGTSEPTPTQINYLAPASQIEIDPEKVFFWTITPRGALKINYRQLARFLMDNGYYKYRFNPDDISFIHIDQNVVEVVTADNIRDFILCYLDSIDEEAAYNLFADSSKMKKEYLSLLMEKKPAFISDTEKESWVFYLNTAVRIEPNNVTEVPYIDLSGYIWKAQIIQRNFKLNMNGSCDFLKFMVNLSGGDMSRFSSLASGVGYEMHRYKNPSNVKTLILTEEELTEKPEGGTGKGLIFQAISKIRVVVFIDGKSFNSGKNFVWQRVNPDTNIVVLDDIPKNFNFENLFSILTTGWPVEKKNKGEMYLTPEQSPKIGIPTNYVIKGDNSAIRRRKFEVEIHKHYSDSFQPYDEFNRNFFLDWDENEWNGFDNLMIGCIKLYLEKGLISVDYINLKTKRFIAQTSHEFMQYAEQNFTNNSRYARNEEHRKFTEQNPGSYCKSASMFYQWMRDYGDFKQWTYKDAGHGCMYIEYGEVSEDIPVNDELPW